MKAGVSTACLYPKPTEDALYDLCLSGISTVEIFVNAPSECSPVFVGDLAAMLRRSETAVQTQLYRARRLLKDILGEEVTP